MSAPMPVPMQPEIPVPIQNSIPPQMPYGIQDRWSMYRPENLENLNKESEYLNQIVAQENLPPTLIEQPSKIDSLIGGIGSQDDEISPETFTDNILPEWRDIQVTKREKFLKEFMMKFLAYQVVEAHHSSQIDKAFWNWCFGLFPCSSTSTCRFKQFSDIWISFLCFKPKFWVQFNKWYQNCNHTVIEEAKNDYLREKLKV
jgi:hypothetical protein